MNRARVGYFGAACVATCVWASIVFLGQSARFEHHGLINAIRGGEPVDDAKHLQRAIQDFENAIRTLPCNSGLSADLTLLRASAADAAGDSDDGDDAALTGLRDSMVQELSCNPRDGKVWLDLATIESYREGYAKRAKDAYLMSRDVTPGESWLAEKRLIFALGFRPLFDKEAMEVAQADLIVLERAHPNRMSAVVKAAGVETPEQLYAVFSATREKPRDGEF